MSIVIMLMIGGWVTTLSMICGYGLKESGKLLKMRRSLALRLDSSVAAAIPASGEIMRHEVA